jgi:hypothetical protein
VFSKVYIQKDPNPNSHSGEVGRIVWTYDFQKSVPHSGDDGNLTDAPGLLQHNHRDSMLATSIS